MRVVHLADVRGLGVPLSARERVAVVHCVCRLLHDQAQSGHTHAAPRFADLCISELGDVVISRSAIVSALENEPSLTSLIDELLPEDPAEVLPPPPRWDGRSTTSPASGEDDAVVLRELFARAIAAGVCPWQYGAQTTTATFADSEASDLAPPIDDVQIEMIEPQSVESLFKSEAETAAEAAAAAELEAEPDAEAEAVEVETDAALDTDDTDRAIAFEIAAAMPAESPVSGILAAPQQSSGAPPWVRRAVFWGLAVNVALGIAIAWPMLSIPRIGDLLPSGAREARVEAGADRAGAAKPDTDANAPRPTTSRSAGAAVSQAIVAPPLAAAEVVARPAGVVWSLASSSVAALVHSTAGIAVPGVEDADDATLSPDGALVAFVSDRDGERGVFVAHRDGRNVTRASGDGRASAPAWSPDGGRLAFVRAEADHPTVWNLWMRDMRSGELTPLTSHARGIVRGASWFPNGARLCFGYGNRLFVVDVASRREQPVTSTVASGPIRTPSVSPDGARIAFDVEGDGIWLLDVARGSLERVIDEPAASGLTWTRTGGILYYSLQAREWRAWERDPRS